MLSVFWRLQARTFVLVGDHNQLPPLVTSAAAEAGGLGRSLFRLLSEAHPQVHAPRILIRPSRYLRGRCWTF